MSLIVTALSAVELAGTLAPGLGPACTILAEIYRLVTKLEDNKAQARCLASRASNVMDIISQELNNVRKGKQSSIPFDVEANLLILEETLSDIRDVMLKLRKDRSISRLFKADTHREEIMRAHNRLSDCLQIFQISTQIGVRKWQDEYEAARIEDENSLRERLNKLDENGNEVLRQIGIVGMAQMEMIERVSEIQKSIARDVEHKRLAFFDHAVTLSEAYSSARTDAPISSIPSRWVIPRRALQIDDSTLLGSSIFARVCKGKWSGVTVAVKQLADSAPGIALAKEVATWKELQHPNIAQFYGASAPRDTPGFLVFEYMKNGDVPTYIQNYPEANRLKLITDISHGMRHLHEVARITHGNLKATNVMISDAGHARIIDFGMATIKQETISAQVISSEVDAGLNCMAPERIRGRLSPAGDVYSFSMTAYQIFTGEVPFNGASMEDIIRRVLTKGERPQRPSNSALMAKRGLSEEIWNLMERCWVTERTKRPSFILIVKELTGDDEL